MNKLGFIVLLNISIISSAMACPDISGKYLRLNALGCKMSKLENSRSAPLVPFSIHDKQDEYISDGEEFTITQNKCKSITITYTNSGETYSNTAGRIEKFVIDLTQGKVKTTKNSISYSKKTKETNCYMGCMSSIGTDKLTIDKKENGNLRIFAKQTVIGFANLFIPVIWSDKIDCNVERIE